MSRGIGKLALLGLCLFWACGMAAAACAVRLQIAFPDGSKACLSDYPLGERRAAGTVGAVQNALPGSGWFHMALPRSPAMCPEAIGLERVTVATGGTGGAVGIAAPTNAPETRAAEAIGRCQRLAGAAARGSPCECIAVLGDGRSLVARADFERIAREAPGQQSEPLRAGAGAGPSAAPVTPQRAEVAPPLSRAAPSAPGPSATTTSTTTTATPAPATAPGSVGPSAAEIAALRQQIESLQTQMARQGSTVAAPQPASRVAARRLRTRALVIGNGAYKELGALPNPRRDAEAIAAKFRQFGIEVDLVLDTDRSSLVRALNDYQNRAAGYDVNILFYAGHGLQVGGINYIVPVDMSGGGATVGSVKLNAVSLNDALEYLPARTRVVFLDACRDNPLARSLLATRGGAGLGLAPVNTTSGTLVAYATRDGSTAEDGGGRNSPYTSALLQHLDAEEDIAVVLRRVRQAVMKATSNRQEPWEYGSLVGDELVLSRLAR